MWGADTHSQQWATITLIWTQIPTVASPLLLPLTYSYNPDRTTQGSFTGLEECFSHTPNASRQVFLYTKLTCLSSVLLRVAWIGTSNIVMWSGRLYDWHSYRWGRTYMTRERIHFKSNFFYSGTSPSYLAHLLSLWLVKATRARN